MTVRLPPLPTVSDIIRLFKLQSRKHLSQNFMLDMNLTRKFVKSAGKIKDGYVCEVGPGPGGITRAILESDIKELSVIEKDRRFIPSLQLLSEICDKKLKIYQGDVLRFDMTDMFPESLIKAWDDMPPNIHIMGNLPFNVSTPLIIQYLECISNKTGAWKYGRTKLTFTFQKEIAERMVAPIQSKDRCRLSVMCQYLCNIHHKFTIPGKAFVPSPDVDVGVVHLVPRKVPLIDQPFKLVEKVVRHIFHHRNKFFIKNLRTLFPPKMSELADEMLEFAQIKPECRSFELSIDDIGRLCQAYSIICERLPHIFDYDYRSTEGLRDLKSFKLEKKAEKKKQLESEKTLQKQNESEILTLN